MIDTTRRAFIFLVASALPVLALALLPWGKVEHNWQAYQQDYLAAAGTDGNDPVAIRQINPRLGPDGQPTSAASPELCQTCHVGLEEISPSHPVETFGCVMCHGGIGLALDKDEAHSGLRPNPADLSLAAESCGQAGCHAGYADAGRNHIDQVSRSLQATYAGGIALVRYTFGAQKDLPPRFGVVSGVDPSPLPETVAALAAYIAGPEAGPAEAQFARNCLEGGCHLSEPAVEQPYHYRATGCAACHILYNEEGQYTGADPTLAQDEPGHPARHQFTTAIPYNQCNHCHNRGNYSLRTMTFTPRPDLPPAGNPMPETMPAEGRRLREYYQPIGQFTLCEWELDCIDCHTQQEAMGDGHFWPDQKAMQYVQCRTCHGTLSEPPPTAEITAPDDPALRLARLNGHYTLSR